MIFLVWQTSLELGSGCVAQLVEGLLLIPEVLDSNSVISKNLFILNMCLLSTVYWKDEYKEKEAGDGPFFKKNQFDKCCTPIWREINIVKWGQTAK